jgi:hypothetical protein
MAYKINSTSIINDTTAFLNVGILTATSFSGKGTIPSGTVMIFTDAAAPTGFTKLTTHNNKSLRVVSGTGGGSGGTTDFTTVFSNLSIPFSGTSGATTLTTPQLPSHTHPGALASGSIAVGGSNSFTVPGTIGSTGGSGDHSHSITGSGPLNLQVKYVDAIIASRDA